MAEEKQEHFTLCDDVTGCEICGMDKIDADGNPTGGYATGTGLDIVWQDGPLGRGDGRVEPSGAFVESVLLACAHRLEFYEESKFACEANQVALGHIRKALDALRARRREREARGVQGTYEV